jgi:UTP-glucose-1-phosphate uridylyltransferase
MINFVSEGFKSDIQTHFDNDISIEVKLEKQDRRTDAQGSATVYGE